MELRQRGNHSSRPPFYLLTPTSLLPLIYGGYKTAVNAEVFKPLPFPLKHWFSNFGHIRAPGGNVLLQWAWIAFINSPGDFHAHQNLQTTALNNPKPGFKSQLYLLLTGILSMLTIPCLFPVKQLHLTCKISSQDHFSHDNHMQVHMDTTKPSSRHVGRAQKLVVTAVVIQETSISKPSLLQPPSHLLPTSLLQ